MNKYDDAIYFVHMLENQLGIVVLGSHNKNCICTVLKTSAKSFISSPILYGNYADVNYLRVIIKKVAKNEKKTNVRLSDSKKITKVTLRKKTQCFL